MSATVITISDEGQAKATRKSKKFLLSVTSLIVPKRKQDRRKVIHSVKVGFALVLVSLLYLLDPLYKQFGDNAMWAIMTVVVIFEFFAGATLSKGLNRGIGTIAGGGLGCLAAFLADETSGIGNLLVIGASVFIFGVAATYTRMIPSIKKRYDYGVMIFILTFNLVVVSGLRADEIMELALDRLSTIGIGFVICVFTSLFVFPTWASDELHESTVTKFETLACCIEGCMEDYFKAANENETQTSTSFTNCKRLLCSHSNEEALANFARWEPWHGRFGFSYPWGKYLHIGKDITELAATIYSLKGCLDSPTETFSTTQRQSIKESCEVVGSSLAWTLRELGESIRKMEKSYSMAQIGPKLQIMKKELSQASFHLQLGELKTDNRLAFLFLLIQVVDKVQVLAKEVEKLGEIAEFKTK